jgi:hypothetical protein
MVANITVGRFLSRLKLHVCQQNDLTENGSFYLFRRAESITVPNP